MPRECARWSALCEPTGPAGAVPPWIGHESRVDGSQHGGGALARFELVAVAFVAGAGGRIGVLFVVDRDGVPLFDGEPSVLVQHRPGAAAGAMVVEVPERCPASAQELVAGATEAIARVLDAAYDQFGELVREQLLGSTVEMEGARDAFGEH